MSTTPISPASTPEGRQGLYRIKLNIPAAALTAHTKVLYFSDEDRAILSKDLDASTFGVEDPDVPTTPPSTASSDLTTPTSRELPQDFAALYVGSDDDFYDNPKEIDRAPVTPAGNRNLRVNVTGKVPLHISKFADPHPEEFHMYSYVANVQLSWDDINVYSAKLLPDTASNNTWTYVQKYLRLVIYQERAAQLEEWPRRMIPRPKMSYLQVPQYCNPPLRQNFRDVYDATHMTALLKYGDRLSVTLVHPELDELVMEVPYMSGSTEHSMEPLTDGILGFGPRMYQPHLFSTDTSKRAPPSFMEAIMEHPGLVNIPLEFDITSSDTGLVSILTSAHKTIKTHTSRFHTTADAWKVTLVGFTVTRLEGTSRTPHSIHVDLLDADVSAIRLRFFWIQAAYTISNAEEAYAVHVPAFLGKVGQPGHRHLPKVPFTRARPDSPGYLGRVFRPDSPGFPRGVVRPDSPGFPRGAARPDPVEVWLNLPKHAAATFKTSDTWRWVSKDRHTREHKGPMQAADHQAVVQARHCTRWQWTDGRR
ncbi:uncharacterized protein BXZ73DRAFT_85505 [Epithele typhae]|uniref:uncharacterized protein n=1 Tax=Epithele typhae TaxID=378194 RepID=UPI002008A84B|nr:uncharacterized protein BXZ73DRAFT_85505 [Epithele typhae]KAH9903887.1 hypothetical protein BXZ73DRAFT_85505 [Epithele typhae]